MAWSGWLELWTGFSKTGRYTRKSWLRFDLFGYAGPSPSLFGPLSKFNVISRWPSWNIQSDALVSKRTFRKRGGKFGFHLHLTIGCHPFKGPGGDRMKLKTVQLSDMLCFDTTWSNMQPHTGRPSRSCSWQNEFLKHGDARIYWKQKCSFGIHNHPDRWTSY